MNNYLYVFGCESGFLKEPLIPYSNAFCAFSVEFISPKDKKGINFCRLK
jgi:hypothetical protein